MAKYHLTNRAVEDLSNIWEYTVDTWSERQAEDDCHIAGQWIYHP